MSTDVKCVDQGALAEAIQRVRSEGESSSEGWCLVSHAGGDPNTIQVAAEGTGCDNLVEALKETEVMYGLLKMTETIDMSNTIKFVYIRWVGEKVPFVKKGRYGVMHGSVQQFFQPAHCTIEATTPGELAREVIMNGITETSGTKSKVVDNERAEALPHRGFTSVPINQPPKSRATAPIAVSSKGAAVTIGDDVREAINAVRKDDTGTTWTLLGYQDNDVKKPLVVVQSGTGKVDEMTELLQDEAVGYGIYRTTDIIDGHTVVRFAYIIWVGDAVKTMAKGSISTHKGSLAELFEGCHVTLYGNSRSEITERILLDKVTVLMELVKIGVLTDVQYANVENGHNYHKTATRYYRQSLEMVKKAVRAWDREKVQIILQLGDLIDGKARRFGGPSAAKEAFELAMTTLYEINAPMGHCVGNHELYNFNRSQLNELMKKFNSKNEMGYYEMRPCSKVSVIVLDCYDVSVLGARGECGNELATKILAVNPNSDQNDPSGLDGFEQRFVAYNGGISKQQLEWLKKTLSACEEENRIVMVFGHIGLLEGHVGGDSMLWNYSEVLQELHNCKRVVCYMHGHDHCTGVITKDDQGVWHVNAPAIIEADPSVERAFLTVTVYNEELLLTGIGDSPQKLSFRSQ